MAKASIVTSTAAVEVRVRHISGEKKVRLEVGDVCLFIEPDDAYEIGAKLIAIGATAGTRFPSMPQAGNGVTADPEVEAVA